MKKIQIIITLLLLNGVTAQSSEDGLKRGYFSSGELASEIDSKGGLGKLYYRNGQIKMEYTKDAQKEYYENGKLKSESKHLSNESVENKFNEFTAATNINPKTK